MDKTLAAAGYLLSLGNGSLSILKLVKMLYYADRLALECWHRTITGDAFYSLPEGPIVSTAYDLMKGEGPEQLQEKWFTFIQPRHGNTIALKQMPDTSFLSDAEKETLAASYRKIAPMSNVSAWMHKFFPEWEDPKGSSKRIEPKTVLRLLTPLTEDQISAIEEEVAQAAFMEARFGAPANA
jgi:uncharacterized phage-associated protein